MGKYFIMQKGDTELNVGEWVSVDRIVAAHKEAIGRLGYDTFARAVISSSPTEKELLRFGKS